MKYVMKYVQKQTTDQLMIYNQYVTLKCHKPQVTELS